MSFPSHPTASAMLYDQEDAKTMPPPYTAMRPSSEQRNDHVITIQTRVEVFGEYVSSYLVDSMR